MPFMLLSAAYKGENGATKSNSKPQNRAIQRQLGLTVGMFHDASLSFEEHMHNALQLHNVLQICKAMLHMVTIVIKGTDTAYRDCSIQGVIEL